MYKSGLTQAEGPGYSAPDHENKNNNSVGKEVAVNCTLKHNSYTRTTTTVVVMPNLHKLSTRRETANLRSVSQTAQQHNSSTVVVVPTIEYFCCCEKCTTDCTTMIPPLVYGRHVFTSVLLTTVLSVDLYNFTVGTNYDTTIIL